VEEFFLLLGLFAGYAQTAKKNIILTAQYKQISNEEAVFDKWLCLLKN
jgi:hypothetical protein